MGDWGNSDRNLLHMNKVEEFAAWAQQNGYAREPSKGRYEVLRLRWPGGSPLLYYRREHANCGGGVPQHATSTGPGTKLIRRWFRARNKAAANLMAAQFGGHDSRAFSPGGTK